MVVIGGPTATGKTALSVALAERRGDVELVNADSRQVLAGLRVATFRPSADELHGVPSHLFGVVDPGTPFTVADWVARARDVVAAIGAAGHRACVVGGTGLYIRALTDGWTLGGVAPDAARRSAWEAVIRQPGGLGRLFEELGRLDPQAAESVDGRNPRRVIRALEVAEAETGNARRKQGRGGPPGPDLAHRAGVQIALDVRRPVHRELVEGRVDAMFRGEALIHEAQEALDRGVGREPLGRAGIGYREALAVIDGAMTVEDGREVVIRRTLRYAKAQRTWFRGHRDLIWLTWESSPLELLDQVVAMLRTNVCANG